MKANTWREAVPPDLFREEKVSGIDPKKIRNLQKAIISRSKGCPLDSFQLLNRWEREPIKSLRVRKSIKDLLTGVMFYTTQKVGYRVTEHLRVLNPKTTFADLKSAVGIISHWPTSISRGSLWKLRSLLSIAEHTTDLARI